MADVLVVDDMATDRELAGKVVTKSGHRPIYASSAPEAVEMAKSRSPALILLDVVMPGTPGYAVCRSLKDDPATNGIPIVLVTSKGEPSDVFWGKKQGAQDVLKKPYTPESLEKMIRDHIK